MKQGTLKRAANLAVVLSLTIGTFAPLANAQQRDLRTFLVGTWRQPTQLGYVETVFQSFGGFKSVIYVNGTNDPARLTGGWEIRNGNELWMHNMAWYPMYERHYDGTKTPIQVRPWDSTPIDIIDANHVRTSAGVSTRVSR